MHQKHLTRKRFHMAKWHDAGGQIDQMDTIMRHFASIFTVIEL